MPNFQKILFPIDLSEACSSAAPFVVALAQRSHADVMLLHVLEMPPAYFGDWYGFPALVDVPELREGRGNAVQSFIAGKFPGVPFDTEMLEGDPSRSIVAYAEKRGADLIMMPTHGFGVFRDLLLGSVTAKVLHDSKCPVWTAAHMETAPPPSNGYERMLCAVDLTPKSVATMKFADEFAREFGAKLWLLHAAPGAETRPNKYFDADLQEYLQTEARQTIAKMQSDAGLSIPVCIGAGEVSHVVREAAENHQADLVITGRGHATQRFGRLRTNVYSIVRDSPCPVISL